MTGVYYRRILLGSALLLTFAIFLAIGMSVSARVDRFIDDQRYLFFEQRNSVQAEVKLAESRLRQLVVLHEARWESKNEPSQSRQLTERYGALLNANHGVVLADRDLSLSPYTIIATTPQRSDQQLVRLISVLRDISPAPAIRSGPARAGSFVYGDTRKFFAFHPALDMATESRDENTLDVATVSQQETEPIEQALLSAAHRKRGGRRIVWTPPHVSPMTGVPVIQYAMPVMQGPKRVAVVGATLRLQDIPELFQDNRNQQPNFFLLSQNASQLLSQAPSQSAEQQLAKVIRAQDTLLRSAGEVPNLVNIHGTFLLMQRIPGPEWVAVYAFDWKTILNGLKPELLVIAIAGFSVLFILWALVAIFDRYVLTPVQRKAKQIYESEAFNRTVVATAPVGLSVTNPTDGEVIFQNAIATDILSRTPDGTAAFYGELNRAISEQEKGGEGFSTPQLVLRKEIQIGTQHDVPIMVGVTAVATRYLSRDVILCGLTDISERKETQRLLLEAKQSADAASHAKSMFLAAVSHEIRTPLHAALGHLELLSLQQLTADQSSLVKTIQRVFGALGGLLNDILDFSKIEARELRLESTEFSPHELIETCTRTFAPVLASKNVQFLALIDPDLPNVLEGDTLRIQQIVMNLLSNAAKFTSAGQVVLEVAKTGQSGDVCDMRITVKDSGIGIAPADLAQLFTAFTQLGTSVARRFGGTGLGLSLCKRLAELMGGSISVVSTHGVGTKFTVDLPLRLATNVLPEPTGAEGAVARSPDSAASVLVCCAHEQWRALLCAQLQKWGYNAVVLPNQPGQHPICDITLVAHLGVWDIQDQLRLRGIDPHTDSVLMLCEHYPLEPERRAGVVVASSLSRESFFRGLFLARQADDELTHVWETEPILIGVTPVDQRILVVEDDDVSRSLLYEQLRTLGYHNVDCVTDARSAIQECCNHEYDLVISDLNLPDMNGDALLRELRAAGNSVPVILNSAGLQFAAIGTSEDEGFAAKLSKPTSIDQLRTVLDQVLPRKDQVSSQAPIVAATSARLADFGGRLWELFAQSWTKDSALLSESMDAGDKPLFMRRLHKVKGALLVMQQLPLATLCDTLERCCERKGLEAVVPMFRQFLERVASQIEQNNDAPPSTAIPS